MTTAPPVADTDLATRQSLARGSLGITLLHVERARRGLIPWKAVHQRLADVRLSIDGNEASLFLGAPAMAYVLHLTAADSDRYTGALHTLDDIVAAHTRRRLAAAHTRIDQGRYATFAEYDLLRGLTGLGALLLRRRPAGDELKTVLHYLVRLTEPVAGPRKQPLPGWWVGHTPSSQKTAAPGGHANAGLAHGITGPLALLALAKRRGVTVDGHDTAMNRICHWLDRIRHSDHRGSRWPRWISRTGPAPMRPAAPSWCYGTPGLARAQQLAAIALADENRKRMAERALLHCLTDSGQLDQLTDRGLCHGAGGLLRTVQRVAEDAETPTAFTDRLPGLRERFLTLNPSEDPGFLQGTAGSTLAFQSAEPGSGPATDWDACLLLC
ncbi:lanthionine synthetase C family protein [Streptomyces albus]|uniref:lanthionine synthetase C family protein n=1 Tax=Streptomyces albus TaxID=1888 RepID=UPI0004C4B003|nr:lanthionine synthetase C family protein [Streptomyces albus]